MGTNSRKRSWKLKKNSTTGKNIKLLQPRGNNGWRHTWKRARIERAFEDNCLWKEKKLGKNQSATRKNSRFWKEFLILFSSLTIGLKNFQKSKDVVFRKFFEQGGLFGKTWTKKVRYFLWKYYFFWKKYILSELPWTNKTLHVLLEFL